MLTPDFQGDLEAVAAVVAERPEIFNHDMETVARLYARFRPSPSTAGRSNSPCCQADVAGSRTKSRLMVGLGEDAGEVHGLLRDLRAHRVDIVTIGQYLRPSVKHHPLIRFWHPDEFAALRAYGLGLGFAHVEAARWCAPATTPPARSRRRPRSEPVPRSLESIWLGIVPYQQAWQLQRRLAEARVAGEIGDCLLLLEHPPVYTLGATPTRSTSGWPGRAARPGGGMPGGGPGRLGDLPRPRPAGRLPDRPAVRGVPLRGSPGAGRRGGLRAGSGGRADRHRRATDPRQPPARFTGAWVGEAKLAAIGVKLARGVTQHGVALNVTTDLSWFSRVVPCGIADAGVTSMARAGVLGVTPESVAPDLAACTAEALGAAPAQPGSGLLRLAAAIPAAA